MTVCGPAEPLVAGFTREVIFQILGGRYRPSYRPLNDGIITGRLNDGRRFEGRGLLKVVPAKRRY